MSRTALPLLIRQVRRLVAPQPATVADAALLDRWRSERDESAFELLLWRHGPMVWHTCRRMLRHDQDAEDAFQAVFLILARKASQIGRGESLAGWLYRVAHRTALAARSRRTRLVPAGSALEQVADRPRSPNELEGVLDEELTRLPEKYRLVFVLCCLQGATVDEAAEQLGCPRGTIGTRIAWVKQRLRDRLSNRGFDLPERFALGMVPATLVSATCNVIERSMTDPAATDVVVALSEEVIRMTMTSKLQSSVICLAIVALMATGTGWWLDSRASAEKPVAKAPKNPGAKAPGEGKKVGVPADVSGIVKEISADKKTLTLEQPAKNKGEAATTTTIQIPEKLDLLFSGVGPGEAKIQKGYHATGWLVKGSKDTVARLHLSGPHSAKGPPADLSGLISAVAGDGKSFTIHFPGKKGVEGRDVVVKLGDRAEVLYTGVPAGGTKLTAEMGATVWFVKDSKDTAARVHVHQGKGGLGKGDPAPEVVGKVVAVDKDGKSVTVVLPAKNKGEEGERREIKLTAKTEQFYGNVAAGQAKPGTGYKAMIWLDAGAKDTASKAYLVAPPGGKREHVSGQVTSVAGDGKSFTIVLPSKVKGEAGTETTIKLEPGTSVSYHHVGVGGAQLTKGYAAYIQLEEGKKDVAALVVFQGQGK